MGLIDRLFSKQTVSDATMNYFGTLVGYQPIFSSFNGGVYEAALCRAAIHTIATHCSKLTPVVTGPRKDLQRVLEFQPNPWMDTTKFLYKTATILEAENTAFIVPMFDQYYERIVGFYPVQPSMAEVVEQNGKAYIIFQFVNGQQRAIEFENVGILTKFFYKQDFFGESNGALKDTLDLIHTQQQGIQEGIKQSATVRFLGRLAQALKADDIEAERKRWVASNLSSANNGGIALVDTKYADIKQIESRPYVIDPEQMRMVKDNVFDWFNISENIIQAKFEPEEWSAFYEAKIEPFAIQLSLVLSNLVFTAEQKKRGDRIQFTANRLQYASTKEKLNVVSQSLDRGIMTRNEAREIFNMAPVEGGDDFIIRGEYYNADEKMNEIEEEEDEDE